MELAAAETHKMGAKTLAQRYFVSTEIFAEEQRTIFSSQWVLAGHQSQIPRTGDYFLAQVAGESLIIVRDQKNAIRAFYNVCRHRGTRLIEESAGHAAAFLRSFLQGSVAARFTPGPIPWMDA